MFSLSTIAAMERKAARKSRERHLLPFYIHSQEELDHLATPLEFPFIGSRRPRGWALQQTYFVDSSGWGSEDEPALTYHAFLEKLRPGFGYAIVSVGQFQVYVGEFKPTEKALAAYQEALAAY